VDRARNGVLEVNEQVFAVAAHAVAVETNEVVERGTKGLDQSELPHASALGRLSNKIRCQQLTDGFDLG
jgi:hypothetical protein